MTQPIVELSGVNLSIHGNTILENISFTLKKGEYVGLIGPNGAGKSTLLKIILKKIEPSSGKVFVADKTKIGYVPQNIFAGEKFFPISVEEVLSLGDSSFWFCSSKKEKQKMKEKLLQVGLDERFLAKNFQKLSGGQKQRVIIARALLQDPDLLLFDEPLSNIDYGSKMQLYALFAELNQKFGVSILFVSHEVEHITGTCHRILCLNKHLHEGCHPLDFVSFKHNQETIDAQTLLQPVHHHHDHSHCNHG